MSFRGENLSVLQLHGSPDPPRTLPTSRSSEFGWFDVEALLSSRVQQTGFWGGNVYEKQDTVGSKVYEGSALPPALERVFAWLEEVEDAVRKDNIADVLEAITGVRESPSLLASSSRGQDGGEVINTEAVTKSDFSLTSRDQPPLAIGIYAHRVIRKRHWLLWSSCETQYLVVLGTKNELLKAWRSLDDFSQLASEAKGLRIARVDKHWDAVEDMLYRKNGQHTSTYRRTQASRLKFFLATLIEELDERDIEVLVDFVRGPTTYVVVGAEILESDSVGTDNDSASRGDGGEQVIATHKASDERRSTDDAAELSEEATIAAMSNGLSHPLASMSDQSRKQQYRYLMPEPHTLDGL